MERRATSQDVADSAGVSRSAVSLVLNGRGQGNISAEKQAAILAAAEELDYSPNPVALSLRTRRSATIGGDGLHRDHGVRRPVPPGGSERAGHTATFCWSSTLSTRGRPRSERSTRSAVGR